MPYFSTFLPLNRVPDHLIGTARRWTGRSPYLPELDRTQSVFVHIPKAAGTSVSQALYGCQVGHVGAEVFRAADPERFERYYSFTVVRHPEDRFLSAFRYLQAGGGTPADRAFRDRHLTRLPHRKAVLEQFAYEARGAGWGRLLDWGHFRPQHRFIAVDGAILVDQVIRLDDLDVAFPRLSERILGAPSPLPRLNRSDGTKEDGLDEAERALVGEIYAEDFKLLGFDP